MLRRIIEDLTWWRVYGQTKRTMYRQANTQLTRALLKMGALRRVA
jgi:hypothetical protein